MNERLCTFETQMTTLVFEEEVGSRVLGAFILP
jgi:hypothetical protein